MADDVMLQAKYDRLVDLIRPMMRVIVAFSGGVDSTFLARAAKDALGDGALLVTADSETYPASELEETRRLAGLLGMRHEIVRTHELDRPEYARNSPDRCFHCKEELFTRLEPIACQAGSAQLIYGAIMDDLGDHRPGMKAAEARGVRAPLIEATLWKEEIRALSRGLGLPTWDKPSFACLSSRFQYGDVITAPKLRQIDAAEAFLRSLGFRQFRVRHHDRLARIELPSEEMARLWEGDRQGAIVRRFRELGYLYVTLDLQGFRSGSANEALKWIGKKVRALLEAVSSGATTPEQALARLRTLPVDDLGFARVDLHRSLRHGVPEAVFCQGKTAEQVVAIVRRVAESHDNVLATRASPDVVAALAASGLPCRVHEGARLVVVKPAPTDGVGLIIVMSAGTADQSVAEEAAVTAEAMGNHVERLYDCGVAGLHRLVPHLDRLNEANAIIAVAGMEGALPSVLAGLVDRPIIAVPTSVGYGVSFGGVAALLAMLNSCAPGVSVVNIDNGYGAAAQASQINKLASKLR